MNKSVSLTEHARIRLRERRINSKWIEETVLDPDRVESGDKGVERRFRAISQFDGRVLRVACVETNSSIRVICSIGTRGESLTDITYDAEADAVYITIGNGIVDRTEETGPFIYDVDTEGHIIGIEILSASKVLAPGDWKKARAPGKARVGATE